MQRTGWLLLCLMGLIWLGGELSGPAPSLPSHSSPSWRRTNAGWEQLEQPTLAPDPDHPALHPGLVAAAQMLVSLLALVAWDAGKQERHDASG